jgi:hypothetical protein
MLDVHPPEERIHGFRDFFLHLFTITIGLLIALGLEATVEAAHHHHQRKEAEILLRQELTANREGLLAAKPVVIDELKNMLKLRAYLESVIDGKPGDSHGISIAFREGPIPDAAWRTASSTDVLNFMDYDEVGRFAMAYKQQTMLQAAEEKTLDDYLLVGSILRDVTNPTMVDKEGAVTALPFVRQAIAHLDGMLAIGGGTLPAYDDALKQ